MLADLDIAISRYLTAETLPGQSIKVDHAYATVIMRWLHVICGVMWVGLLYYFNFVQLFSIHNINPTSIRFTSNTTYTNSVKMKSVSVFINFCFCNQNKTFLTPTFHC
jgi:hypothetical protein